MSARDVIEQSNEFRLACEQAMRSPLVVADHIVRDLETAGHVILSPDEVRGIREAALEEAAETVRKMIPVIPYDGPSTPMQEIEYTSLGFAMTAIRSLKGGRDAQ